MQTRTKHQFAFFPLPHPEAVGAHISILSVSCPVPSSVHPGNRLPVPTSEDRIAPASLIAFSFAQADPLPSIFLVTAPYIIFQEDLAPLNMA